MQSLNNSSVQILLSAIFNPWLQTPLRKDGCSTVRLKWIGWDWKFPGGSKYWAPRVNNKLICGKGSLKSLYNYFLGFQFLFLIIVFLLLIILFGPQVAVETTLIPQLLLLFFNKGIEGQICILVHQKYWITFKNFYYKWLKSIQQSQSFAVNEKQRSRINHSLLANINFVQIKIAKKYSFLKEWASWHRKAFNTNFMFLHWNSSCFRNIRIKAFNGVTKVLLLLQEISRLHV